MPKKLKVGKLPNDLLKHLLQQIPLIDENLVISPSIGCDAAGLHLQDDYWSVTTDPITFASKNAPKYSIAININDVVCTGCEPQYFLSTILLPEGTTDYQLQEFWRQFIEELQRYRIQAIGGHTEITTAVNIPVIVGQMIGRLKAPKFYDIRHAQAGNKILLWRPVAIEGTALIAQERYQDLAKYIPEFQLDTMCELIEHIGLCVLPAGKKLFNQAGVVCLHDPTEGGIATALHEIADACGLGLRIDHNAIPVLSETKQLADILKFDPLGLIASGCLLIVCEQDATERLMNLFAGEVIAEIGEITESKERVLLHGKKQNELPRFDQDEVARALSSPI